MSEGRLWISVYMCCYIQDVTGKRVLRCKGLTDKLRREGSQSLVVLESEGLKHKPDSVQAFKGLLSNSAADVNRE